MFSKILIPIGIFILFQAFKMPVAKEYSTVINIEMLTERQNFLYLGGLFILVGIILIAIDRIKRKNLVEDNDSEKSCFVSNNNNFWDKLNFIPPQLSKYLNDNFAGIDEGLANIIVRIVVGTVSGYLIGAFSFGLIVDVPFSHILPLFPFKLLVNFIIPAVTILYALNKKPILIIFCNIFVIHFVITMYNVLDEYFISSYKLYTHYSPPTITVTSLTISVVGLALVCLYQNTVAAKKA